MNGWMDGRMVEWINVWMDVLMYKNQVH